MGVSKAGTSIAAENGAADEELMAIFGWATKQQTTLYTKKASRRRMAENAVHKLVPKRNKSGAWSLTLSLTVFGVGRK